jgi:hypothetical protein
MQSLDISRDSFQRDKNYSRLKQQQGRIPLDSEANEALSINAEELRRSIHDLICHSGTPDNGFKISFPAEAEDLEERYRLYDFDISKGTYYIGGERYDNVQDSTFLTQGDWLQVAIDIQPPLAPPDPSTTTDVRYDFVWLETWEQNVSATEDSECFERALGGPDGAGRMRRMSRVHVMQDAADNCLDAFDELKESEEGGTIDPDTMRVMSDIRLTVDLTSEGTPENLCAPQTQSGFLGANNQTYRIQLTSPTSYIYGRDNAAPLYRVQISEVTDGDGLGLRKITFLTEPKDVYAQPLSGHAVEIFRWNTYLPNQEKLAEPIGKLITVETDYDPEDSSIILSEPLPQEWVDWFSGDGSDFISELDDPSANKYFYLRIWTGGSGDSVKPDYDIDYGNPNPLGNTGLSLVFTGEGRDGDHWVVAARPNAPDIVTPWTLLDQAPPMGPVRRIAPLALIKWEQNAATEFVPTVHDCRERFRKLCKIHTCCKVTVGDGQHSFGDVNSIAAAIESLPEEGGEICLLEGIFSENVILDDKHNIIIKGCGERTVWQADDEDDSPVLTMHRCSNIKVMHLTIVSQINSCIHCGDIADIEDEHSWNEQITFEKLQLHCSDKLAVWATGCYDFAVVDCEVFCHALSRPRSSSDTPEDFFGQDPAMFIIGVNLELISNSIIVDSDIDAPSRPFGGIQIGGQSHNVVIQGNYIDGGVGNGICLGHLEWIERETDTAPIDEYEVDGAFGYGTKVIITADGCIGIPTQPTPPPTDNEVELIPASGGEIQNLSIQSNQILNMSLNGIGVCHFFDLSENPDFIGLDNTQITHNIISNCLRGEFEKLPMEQMMFKAIGGIALASCDLLDISNNKIFGNAQSVEVSNCGVFVLHGSGFKINDNQVYNNGATPQNNEYFEPFGRRGGIVIGWCNSPAPSIVADNPFSGVEAITTSMAQAITPSGYTALSCHRNFVDSSHGQALKVVALGPTIITNNRFNGAGHSNALLSYFAYFFVLSPGVTSLFLLLGALASYSIVDRDDINADYLLLSELFIAALGGSAVSVFNSAFAEDIYMGSSTTDPDGEIYRGGGETLFNDNQVSLRAHSRSSEGNISSVMVSSLDDVSFGNNQLECENDMPFVLINGFISGTSVRVIGNRFQESLWSSGGSEEASLTNLLSAFTFSLVMNTTSNNQATHCYSINNAESLNFRGTPDGHTVNENNLSIINELYSIDNGFCSLIGEFGGKRAWGSYAFLNKGY